MKEELRKIGLVVVVIASLVAASVIPLAMAYTASQTISCTVTAGSYSVSLNRTSVGYGQMAEGGNMTDPQGAINATNDGGISEDLYIRGANATGPGLWTLADTPGIDQYRHTFNISGTEQNLTTVNKLLADNVPNGASREFTLKIYVPTTINNIGIYTTDVTVVAAP